MSEVLPNPQEFVSSILPKCKRCNHTVCPHCGNWCDTIATTQEQIDELGIVTTESLKDHQIVLCCDGECIFA